MREYILNAHIPDNLEFAWRHLEDLFNTDGCSLMDEGAWNHSQGERSVHECGWKAGSRREGKEGKILHSRAHISMQGCQIDKDAFDRYDKVSCKSYLVLSISMIRHINHFLRSLIKLRMKNLGRKQKK